MSGFKNQMQCTKFDFGRDAGGVTAIPRPKLDLRGPTSKGRKLGKGRERKGREGRGREREEEGKEMDAP